MTTIDRQHVRRIFAEALDLPPVDRLDFVNRSCGGDDRVRDKVLSLLAALRDAGDFLGSPTEPSGPEPVSTSQAMTIVSTTPFEGPGVRIANYKLLQLIGEGGFGSVFMAEQQEPLIRKVALKIIKLGMDTRQVIARFEAERQALAMMDHPNIAKVLDAGATEAGRPYFVMELVKGVPITEYCDKSNLTIRNRLELFGQVCQAVQHAHQKGIIHRDLKPSNVLVILQDGKSFAKVIDFGIAKATSARLTEKTIFTEYRQFIGTPEYMSPEQAEGTLDIDTRTDVYSLGVLLYELLTGATPFDSKSLRSAAYNEIQRIIREVEPPNPSTRLSQNTETIASVAASRKTEPGRLGTIIRGELDWIVMKALEKDRKRRYETASELGTDIQRYLEGQPVTAAPPSARYRLSKFIRRNKGPVAAVLAVTMALAIGVVAFAWQAKIARDQRDWALRAEIAEAEQRKAAEEQRAVAQAQRNVATQEAARTKAMNSFLQQMFIAANPESRSGSREITVIELLNNASAKATKTLRDQPMVEAEARTLLGNTFRSLGRMDEAHTELDRALELRSTGPETGTFAQAESLRAMGVLQEASGDRKGALTTYEQAQAIALKSGDEHQKHAVTGYLDLARIHLNLSQFPESEQALNQAEELAVSLQDTPPSARADLLSTRASLMSFWKDDWAQAESLNEKALELYRKAGEAYLIADALNNLAVVKMTLKKLDEAIPLYQEAIDIMRREFGENNQRTALLSENLANVYFQKKDFDKSLAMLEEVIKIRETIFGADSMPAARTRLNMGSIALSNKDYPNALELADAALPVFRKNLGDQHLDVAQALRNRGAALKGLNDLEGALRDFQAALTIYDAVAKPTHSGRLRALLTMTEIQCLQGHTDQARRIADLAQKDLDPNNKDQAKWIKDFQDQLDKCGDTPKP